MTFSHVANVTTAEYFVADAYGCYGNGLSCYPARNVAVVQCINLIKD